MGIRKDGGPKTKGYKKHKSRCWDCGKPSAVLIIRPSDQHPLCLDCGEAWNPGIEVVKRAEAPEAD